MPLRQPEGGPTWDDRALRSGLAAVLDPYDVAGRKNRIIDAVQKRAIEKALSGIDGKTILDFGCGNGRLLTWLRSRGALAIGLEASAEMVTAARSVAGPCVAHFDGCALPVRNKFLDVALTSMVLQYVPANELTELLVAIAGTLRVDGTLVALEQVAGETLGRGHSLLSYRTALTGAGFRDVVTLPVRRGDSLVMSLAARTWMPGLATLGPLLVKRDAKRRGFEDIHGKSHLDALFIARRA